MFENTPIEQIVATTAQLQVALDQAVCPIIIRDLRSKLDLHRNYLRSINYSESDGIATYDTHPKKITISAPEPRMHPIEKAILNYL